MLKGGFMLTDSLVTESYTFFVFFRQGTQSCLIFFFIFFRPEPLGFYSLATSFLIFRIWFAAPHPFTEPFFNMRRYYFFFYNPACLWLFFFPPQPGGCHETEYPYSAARLNADRTLGATLIYLVGSGIFFTNPSFESLWDSPFYYASYLIYSISYLLSLRPSQCHYSFPQTQQGSVLPE